MATEIIKHRTPAGNEVEIRLTRREKSRRVLLRQGHRGEIAMSVPMNLSMPRIEHFLDKAGKHIDGWLVRRPEKLSYADGSTVDLFGEPWTFRRRSSGVSELDRQNRELILVCDDQFAARRLRRLVTDLTLEWMTSASREMAAKTGKSFRHVRIVDEVSRWGMADGRGILTYVWHLALVPRYVAYYLAAHEVAHLTHMHHRASFWRLVNDLDPNWRAAERWLNSPASLEVLRRL